MGKVVRRKIVGRKIVRIYTDGSCLCNPGHGGWGYVILIGSKEEFEELEGAAKNCVSDNDSIKKFEGSGYVKHATNNRMELLAVTKALEKLEKILDETQEIAQCSAGSIVHDITGVTDSEIQGIEIYSDSAYVINAFNLGWISKWQKNGWKTSSRKSRKSRNEKSRGQKKSVENIDMWKELLLRIDEIAVVTGCNVTFHKVPGHSGIEWNERADKLASSACRSIENN